MSPETPSSPSTPAKPPASASSTLLMMLSFMLVLLMMFDTATRDGVSALMNFILYPLLGFGGEYPVFTLIAAGLLMTTITTLIRNHTTDWVQMAENQKKMSAFNKELREARMAGNTKKVDKLMKIQPEIMKMSMDSSSSQMKLMPITMLVAIPIFFWISYFIYTEASSIVFSVPWEYNAHLTSSHVLPNWILLYSLLSLPVGQVLQRGLKYIDFRKELAELEGEGSDSEH
jgi:uncharacterized membrane protein (DUF106 family)